MKTINAKQLGKQIKRLLKNHFDVSTTSRVKGNFRYIFECKPFASKDELATKYAEACELLKSALGTHSDSSDRHVVWRKVKPGIDFVVIGTIWSPTGAGTFGITVRSKENN